MSQMRHNRLDVCVPVYAYFRFFRDDLQWIILLSNCTRRVPAGPLDTNAVYCSAGLTALRDETFESKLDPLATVDAGQRALSCIRLAVVTGA